MFATVARRLIPEMAMPKKYALAVPPVIRPEYGTIIDNRPVIRGAIRVVAIWIVTVRITALAVRVVSRVSVDWKSDANADRNARVRFRRR